MNALVHVPTDEVEYYKREISVTFENGGRIEITARGDSIAGVLEILFSALSVVKLNHDHAFDLQLRYWHLTEDIESVEIKSRDIVVENYEEASMTIIRRMAADAKTSLVTSLWRHGITLRGERGEL